MKSRAVVSIALAAAVGVSLSACNYFAPQRTTTQYAASDGVHINVGDLELRNLMILAPAIENGQGAQTASLVGAVSNSSGSAGTLTLAYGGVQTTIDLPAGEKYVRLSNGDGPEVTLSGTEFVPGQTIAMTFTPSRAVGGNDANSSAIDVPVLDGTLREYSTLLPTPSTDPSMVPAPTDGPGATATEDAGAGTGTGTGTAGN